MKDPTEFAPVRHISRDVRRIKDRRKGGIHTKPQSQDDTAPVNYPLYEDNSPMDSFRSYPNYDQTNLKPLAGRKPPMLGHQNTFQTQVPGQQGRVAPFGGNFPTFSNYDDDTSLRGSLNGMGYLEDAKYPQPGQPAIFDSPPFWRNGRLAPLQGSYPQHGKQDRSSFPLSWRKTEHEPVEDGSYPQLVKLDRSISPFSVKNGRQAPMVAGKPDRSNSPIYEQNRGLAPLEGGDYPQKEGSISPLSRRNGGMAPFEDGSNRQFGNPGKSDSPLYERNSGLEHLEGGIYHHLGKSDRSNSPLSGRNDGLAPLEGGSYPQLGKSDRSNFLLSGRNYRLAPFEIGSYPQLVKPDRSISPRSWRHVHGLAPLQGATYPTNGGQHMLTSQVLGGGNYPIPGSQYAPFGNQMTTRRQSGREEIPDELVKRNRLWK
jgi:hypothetical protein